MYMKISAFSNTSPKCSNFRILWNPEVLKKLYFVSIIRADSYHKMQQFCDNCDHYESVENVWLSHYNYPWPRGVNSLFNVLKCFALTLVFLCYPKFIIRSLRDSGRVIQEKKNFTRGFYLPCIVFSMLCINCI